MELEEGVESGQGVDWKRIKAKFQGQDAGWKRIKSKSKDMHMSMKYYPPKKGERSVGE